jgi:tetratricopeptide (TPR) repeat protein
LALESNPPDASRDVLGVKGAAVESDRDRQAQAAARSLMDIAFCNMANLLVRAEEAATPELLWMLLAESTITLVSCDRLISKSGQDARAHYLRGVLRFYRDRYADAIADFTKVIALDPENADAYYRRGKARLAEISKLGKSIPMMDDLLKQSRDRVIEALKKMEEQLRAESEALPKVWADFDRAVALQPDRIPFLLMRGKMQVFEYEAGERNIAASKKAADKQRLRKRVDEQRGLAIADLRKVLSLKARTAEDREAVKWAEAEIARLGPSKGGSGK